MRAASFLLFFMLNFGVASAAVTTAKPASINYSGVKAGQSIVLNGQAFTTTTGFTKGTGVSYFGVKDKNGVVGTVYVSAPGNATLNYKGTGYSMDGYGITFSQQTYTVGTNAAGQRTYSYTRSVQGSNLKTTFQYTIGPNRNGQNIWIMNDITVKNSQTGKVYSQWARRPAANGAITTTSPASWVVRNTPATAGEIYTTQFISKMKQNGITINPNTKVNTSTYNLRTAAVDAKGNPVNLTNYWWGSPYTYVYKSGSPSFVANQNGDPWVSFSTTANAQGQSTTYTYTSGGTFYAQLKANRNAQGQWLGWTRYQQAYYPETGLLQTRGWGYGVSRAKSYKWQNQTITSANAQLLGFKPSQNGTGGVYLYSDGTVVSQTTSGMLKVSPISNGTAQATLYNALNGNKATAATIHYAPNGQPTKVTGTLPNGNSFTITYDVNGNPASMKVVNAAGAVTNYTATGTGWKNATTGTITRFANFAANPFAAAAQQIQSIANANFNGLMVANQAQASSPFTAALLYLTGLVEGTLGKLIAILGLIGGVFMYWSGMPKSAIASWSVSVLMAFGPSVIALIFG